MSLKRLLDIEGVEALTHGVFAIAITLLAIEIRVPHVEAAGGSSALWEALGDNWPSYLAYVLGFLLIGNYWITTYRMFTITAGVDHWFLVLNLLFLMGIAAVPFVSALLADYVREGSQQDVAVVVFALWNLILAVLFNIEWRYATRNHRLLVDGVDPVALRRVLRAYAIGPVGWIVAIGLAFINSTLALVAFAALGIFFLFEGPIASLRVRSHQPEDPAAQ